MWRSCSYSLQMVAESRVSFIRCEEKRKMNATFDWICGEYALDSCWWYMVALFRVKFIYVRIQWTRCRYPDTMKPCRWYSPKANDRLNWPETCRRDFERQFRTIFFGVNHFIWSGGRKWVLSGGLLWLKWSRSCDERCTLNSCAQMQPGFLLPWKTWSGASNLVRSRH